MQRHGRADAGQRLHLARIAELFFNRRCCRSLHKFAEARARVGKPPGRDLNAKVIERFGNRFPQPFFVTAL